MNCREFVEFLMDFLDGNLPPEQRSVFEEHMRRCPPCVDYLQSYRQVIALERSACNCDDDVPCEVPEHLVQSILEAQRNSRI